MFQPGALNGIADPQIYLRPQPYKSDFNNPAPNVGVAWNPDQPDGWLGKLLGQSVYRANFGVNYYDEGLINFQTAAGNGPGLSQTLALPPFTPGSLNLQTPLPAYTKTPTDFAFPIAMSGFTFNRGHATIVPDLKTPYVLNWTIGYQREIWALERDRSPLRRQSRQQLVAQLQHQRDEHHRERFPRRVQERAAQSRHQPRQRPHRVREPGAAGPGRAADLRHGFRRRAAQVPAVAAASGYTNGTFVTQLQQGQAGRLANTLAGDFLYLCPMVGNALPGCTSRGYNAPAPYPINFFQANPYGAG